MSNYSKVDNCKQCHKLYRKMSRGLCSDCAEIEEARIKCLYQLLLESEFQGGIAIKELSIETGISMEDIYAFFCRGDLGTAVMFLKLSCPACGTMVLGSQMRGRFCKTCSEEITREVSKKKSPSSEIRVAFHARKQL